MSVTIDKIVRVEYPNSKGALAEQLSYIMTTPPLPELIIANLPEPYDGLPYNDLFHKWVKGTISALEIVIQSKKPQI